MSVPASAPGAAAASPASASEPRNVPALLVKLLAEDLTGAVEVSGTPGGTIHLRHGLVIAVDTPNSPSVETLLIRSERVGEAGWAAALTRRATAAAAQQTENTENEDDLNAALTGMGLIGHGELEAVCIAAVYDAAFAMALSPVRGRPAARIDPGTLSARQQAVLLAANSRRTPRDIAFHLGCGVFPAMLDIARLRARRLVEWEVPRTAALPITARATTPTPTETQTQAGGTHILPRRQRRSRHGDDGAGSDTTEGKGSS